MPERFFFVCPTCGGDRELSRPADGLDYAEGANVSGGAIVSRCWGCGGFGEVEGSAADIEEWGEPIRVEAAPDARYAAPEIEAIAAEDEAAEDKGVRA